MLFSSCRIQFHGWPTQLTSTRLGKHLSILGAELDPGRGRVSVIDWGMLRNNKNSDNMSYLTMKHIPQTISTVSSMIVIGPVFCRAPGFR